MISERLQAQLAWLYMVLNHLFLNIYFFFLLGLEVLYGRRTFCLHLTIGNAHNIVSPAYRIIHFILLFLILEKINLLSSIKVSNSII